MSNNGNSIAYGLTMSMSAAGLAVGTAATQFAWTGTPSIVIDGLPYPTTAHTACAFSNGHTTQTADTVCLYGVWVGATGNVVTYQGEIVGAGALSAGLVALPIPPDATAGLAPLGLIRVAVTNTASSTFVPNTTSLAAANITDTYIDCLKMPSKPYTS